MNWTTSYVWPVMSYVTPSFSETGAMEGALGYFRLRDGRDVTLDGYDLTDLTVMIDDFGIGNRNDQQLRCTERCRDRSKVDASASVAATRYTMDGYNSVVDDPPARDPVCERKNSE